MSHFTVPRRVERILASLGASAELRQDVLGDLQEEFAIRAAWDGPATARRWYYRESLRVAPHLLRDWWGQLGWRDVFRLTEVIVWSAIAVTVLQTLEGAFVIKLANLLGVMPQRVLALSFDLTGPQIMLAWNALFALATGYFAASIGPRARMPSALTTATFWALFFLVAWFRSPGLFPLWFNVVSLITCFSGIALGGMLRASRGEEPEMVA
jgi:hypothetical protein